MSDLDGLVSCLVAHLDTVEQAEYLDVKDRWARHWHDQPDDGGPHVVNVACEHCRRWCLSQDEGPVDEVVKRHLFECVPAADDRRGLVRATRDLIEAWREAVDKFEEAELRRATRQPADKIEEDELLISVMTTLEVMKFAEQALRVWARGWGVTGE